MGITTWTRTKSAEGLKEGKDSLEDRGGTTATRNRTSRGWDSFCDPEGLVEARVFEASPLPPLSPPGQEVFHNCYLPYHRRSIRWRATLGF
jgi:hypothetical protein